MNQIESVVANVFPEYPLIPTFPHAPYGWTPRDAALRAREEGITLTRMHWEEIRGLQEYFARHQGAPRINLREIHDALEEHFHTRGGIERLYELFPGGPVAQGCRLAGLKAPYMASDPSYGTVA